MSEIESIITNERDDGQMNTAKKCASKGALMPLNTAKKPAIERKYGMRRTETVNAQLTKLGIGVILKSAVQKTVSIIKTTRMR